MRIIKTFIASIAFVATAAADDYLRYVKVAPTVTAELYAAKDSVGGLQTYTKVGCPYGPGYVQGVMVTDKAANAVEYNLLLFRISPSGTFTNGGTVDPTDADLENMMPYINISSSDCQVFNDNSVCSVGSLESPIIVAESDGDLYGVLEAVGTPTYASTSDVTITLLVRCSK